MAYRDVPRWYKRMRTASPSVDASPQPNELIQTIRLLLALFNFLQ